MQFRLADPTDLDAVVSVLLDGRSSLAEQGSDQWQGGAPFESIAAYDIDERTLWVAVDDDDKIIGTVTIIEYGEDDYRHVKSGSWLTESANALCEGTVTYAVFHRLAVHHEHVRQGVASFMLKSGCAIEKEHDMKSVRVDTHELNKPMQHGFISCGFTRCCEITITNPYEPTKKRIGFECIL